MGIIKVHKPTYNWGAPPCRSFQFTYSFISIHFDPFQFIYVRTYPFQTCSNQLLQYPLQSTPVHVNALFLIHFNPFQFISTHSNPLLAIQLNPSESILMCISLYIYIHTSSARTRQGRSCLRVIIRPFSSIELARALRLRQWCTVPKVALETPHFTLHSSHFALTLHTPHFTSSYLIWALLTSSQLSSSHLISSHLISSHIMSYYVI